MKKTYFYIIIALILVIVTAVLFSQKTFVAEKHTETEIEESIQDIATDETAKEQEASINEPEPEPEIVTDESVEEQQIVTDETKEDGSIVEISVDEIKGITAKEAEELCYYVMGEKDEDTGFTFSFGTTGAVAKGGKQYYVVRASWLVNNSHMSYIGDFFVSADGKEIYDGIAGVDGYTISDIKRSVK